MKRQRLAFVLLMCPAWASGATYYVDCNANGDAGAGTGTGAAVAWKTISKVNGSSFSAGDSVLFNKGCTWREQLTVPSSGSAGSPITFGAYGTGVAPIIDGSNLITPGTSWAQDAGWYDVVNASSSAGADIHWGVPDTARNSIETASNPAFDGSKVRVTLQARALVATVFDKATIGEMTTGSTLDAAPTAITFNTGSAGASLSADATIVSDEITYAWDHTKRHGFSVYQADQDVRMWSLAGTKAYYTYGDVAATQNITPDGSSDNVLFVLKRLEIYAANSNVWKSTVTTEPKIVFFDGVRGQLKASIVACTSARDWYWATNVLYVYSASDPDTAYTSPGIEAGARDFGVRIGATARDYVTVQDLNTKKHNITGVFSNVTGTQAGLIIQRITSSNNRTDGIFVGQYHASQKTTGVTVDSCTTYENGGSGITIYEKVNDITVTGNVSYQNTWSADLFTAGIHFYSSGDGNNVLVEHNEVYGQYDGLPVWPWSPGCGIWLDTVGTNAVVRYNNVHNNIKVGILIELSTGVAVYYNLVSNNGSYDITATDKDAGILIYRCPSATHVYNNVVYANLLGIAVRGDLVDGGAVTSDNLIKNNISTGSTYWNISATFGGENSGARGTGNVYVNNALGVEKAGMVEWGSGTSKATYAAWESAYGATTSSVQTAPLFLSSSDFRLQDASPAQGAGVNVSLTSDYAGTRVQGVPDIGAYETLGTRFPVTAVTITTAGNVKRYDNRH